MMESWGCFMTDHLFVLLFVFSEEPRSPNFLPSLFRL